MCQYCGLEAVQQYTRCNKCRRRLSRHNRRYWQRVKTNPQVLAANAVVAAYYRKQRREAA